MNKYASAPKACLGTMLIAVTGFSFVVSGQAQSSGSFLPSDFVAAVQSSIVPGGNFVLYSSSGQYKSVAAPSGGVRPDAVAVHPRSSRLLLAADSGSESHLRSKVLGTFGQPILYRAGEGRQIVAIAVGRGGSIYLAEVERCPFCDQPRDFMEVLRLNESGMPQSSFRVPSMHDFVTLVPQIELDESECTLYYTEGTRRIRRYDLCQRATLPDLVGALPGIAAYDIRRLADGSLLVANAGFLVRVSRSGEILQTISGSGVEFRRLSIAARGSFVYAGVGQQIVRLDLNDPERREVITLERVDGPVRDVVSLEELDVAGTVSIPTLGLFSLAFMAVFLAGIAIWTLRK